MVGGASAPTTSRTSGGRGASAGDGETGEGAGSRMPYGNPAGGVREGASASAPRELPDAADADRGSEGEGDERPPPADERHERRDELDGDGGEQEAERRLERERGADGVRRDALGDEHGELRAVGDDEESPREGDGDE